MEETLDDIQFLANSENRIRVLSALIHGSASRRQLQEETGVPRSSAARVLEEAETRGWVGSNGSEYWITPRGEAMVAEIQQSIATTEGINHLGKAIKWLPEPVSDLDFRHFTDARITLPTQENPTAAFDRGLDLISGSSSYRGLTQNSLPQYMRVICDQVEAGDLKFEGVIEERFTEVLQTDRERAETWSVIADRMWVFDGDVPINMHLVDDTALIWLCGEDDEGNNVEPKGLLEVENPHVVSWAESLYEEYLAASKPFSPERLTTK
jgi:predicted transcriptional regulator